MAIMLSRYEGKTPPIFPIVCIGGSAGSLSAYIEILQQIPARSGMAVVIVSHRAMADTERLIRILVNETRQDVVEVTNGMLLEPGRVFVAPPHREITTDGLTLQLAAGQTGSQGWPTLITVFLCSLASMCTSRAVAIIVSGMGQDGSGAMAAVRKAGGTTLAQSDARYLDMPQAAIDTTYVDSILTATQIGEYLASLSHQLAMRMRRSTPIS
jgi:chemotaxis response regulator CheB